MTGAPIPDDDLHAYVDGQLSPDRQAEVARLLQEQPEAAAWVAAYAAQRDALRAGFAPIAAEPLPPLLDLQSIIAQRLVERRTPWRAATWQIAAAVLLAFRPWRSWRLGAAWPVRRHSE